MIIVLNISLKTGVVFGIITIIGLLSWVLIPEEKWMRSERIMAMYEAVD